MTRLSQPAARIGRALRAAGAWLGVRAVLWLGVALLAVLLVADVRSVIVPRPAARPRADGPGPATRPAPGPGWPHRRGPRYDAISEETGLAESWPAEGPPVLWTLELGQGYSGLIAVGDRVFTQTQTLYRQAVVCLDADTGQTLWEHNYGWPYEAAGMYPGPRATPTWHGGRIYFAGPRGLVGCLDAADGRPLWSVNVKEQFAGRGFDFGYSCSPLVEEGKVILPAGGRGARPWAPTTAPPSGPPAISRPATARPCRSRWVAGAWPWLSSRTRWRYWT